MPYVMQIVMLPIVDTAEHLAELMAGDYPTRFLQEFDPEAHKGRGRIKITTDVTQALTFESFAAVMPVLADAEQSAPAPP